MDELTFGEWLQQRMDALGISQSALAKSIGVTHSTVSNYRLRGGIPTPAQAAKLAVPLRVSREEVYRRAGYPVDAAPAGFHETNGQYEARVPFFPDHLISVGRELHALDAAAYEEWLEIGELYLRNRQRSR